MAFSVQKSSFLSPGRPALAPRVCSRNSSRVATPVRALFGFGAPKKAVTSQRALELEDELFATVRGAQPGKLAPKNEEKLDEILEEIRSFGDRNGTRNLNGEYKLVYSTRAIGPTGIVSLKNQALVFEDGGVSRKSEFTFLGVTLGNIRTAGELKITGANSYKAKFGERVVTGIGENLLPKNKGVSDNPPEYLYTVYYLGRSAFVATASISDSDREPVVLIFQKAGVKPSPKAAESDAPPKREGRAGRATLAEREYKERSKAAAAKQPAAAGKEEAAEEKKQSPGGLFGGFFAPPRYIDDEEEEEEEAPTPKGRGRGRAAPAKAKPDASARAEAEAAKREAAAAKRKEEADRKAAEAAAKKEQAAAERAAAQQRKQEIQDFLKQLAADVKSAQTESKNAIQTFRDASRENASLLKESNAAKQLIEQAEASVLEAVEEVEELSSAEKKAADDLREAQKELQKLSK